MLIDLRHRPLFHIYGKWRIFSQDVAYFSISLLSNMENRMIPGRFKELFERRWLWIVILQISFFFASFFIIYERMDTLLFMKFLLLIVFTFIGNLHVKWYFKSGSFFYNRSFCKFSALFVCATLFFDQFVLMQLIAEDRQNLTISVWG